MDLLPANAGYESSNFDANKLSLIFAKLLRYGIIKGIIFPGAIKSGCTLTIPMTQ